jgi:adenylate kinase
MNLFIIGPSGCGKSTQAKLIAEKYNLTHYSMGQLLRDEMASGSELGNEAKSYVDQGKWAPNELVFRILTAKLDQINNQDFSVDGFPSQIDQGIEMDKYLASKSQDMHAIIHLNVTAQEIQDRRQKQLEAGSRFSDAGRTDETPESIAARQKSYDDSINPIIEYYKESGKFWNIDGNRPIEPIFQDIASLLDKLLI